MDNKTPQTEIMIAVSNPDPASVDTSTVDAIRRSLKPEYLALVDAYLRGMSPGDAYVESGMGIEGASDNARKASVILSAPRIRAYLDAMHRTIATRAILSMDAIDQTLTDIATADVSSILNTGMVENPTTGERMAMVTVKNIGELTPAQRASISSIKPMGSAGFAVTFHDKMKALEMLIKRRGGFTENQNVNLSGAVHVFAHVGDNGRGPK
jgi:hypothetical protein